MKAVNSGGYAFKSTAMKRRTLFQSYALPRNYQQAGMNCIPVTWVVAAEPAGF